MQANSQRHVELGGASRRRTASGASYAPPSPAIASAKIYVSSWRVIFLSHLKRLLSSSRSNFSFILLITINNLVDFGTNLPTEKYAQPSVTHILRRLMESIRKALGITMPLTANNDARRAFQPMLTLDFEHFQTLVYSYRRPTLARSVSDPSIVTTNTLKHTSTGETPIQHNNNSSPLHRFATMPPPSTTGRTPLTPKPLRTKFYGYYNFYIEIM